MSTRSRRKGARGELEVLELLRAHGWTRAHRNFASGSAGGGDVTAGPAGVVLEIKRHAGRLDLPAAVRRPRPRAARLTSPSSAIAATASRGARRCRSMSCSRCSG